MKPDDKVRIKGTDATGVITGFSRSKKFIVKGDKSGQEREFSGKELELIQASGFVRKER